jgi:hypothetical protein
LFALFQGGSNHGFALRWRRLRWREVQAREHPFPRFGEGPGRKPLGRVAAEKFNGDVGTVGDRMVAGLAGAGESQGSMVRLTGENRRAKGLGGDIRCFVLIRKGPEIGIGQGTRAVEANDDDVIPLPLIQLDQFVEGANFTGAQDGSQFAACRQSREPGQLLGPVHRKGRRERVGFCQPCPDPTPAWA